MPRIQVFQTFPKPCCRRGAFDRLSPLCGRIKEWTCRNLSHPRSVVWVIMTPSRWPSAPHWAPWWSFFKGCTGSDGEMALAFSTSAPNKLWCSPSISRLGGTLTCHKFTLQEKVTGPEPIFMKELKNGTGPIPPPLFSLLQPMLTLYPLIKKPSPYLFPLSSFPMCLSVSHLFSPSTPHFSLSLTQYLFSLSLCLCLFLSLPLSLHG